MPSISMTPCGDGGHWFMRTTHLVFTSILTPATADAEGRGCLGAHGIDTLEARGRLETGLNRQGGAQALVHLPSREWISNGHFA